MKIELRKQYCPQIALTTATSSKHTKDITTERGKRRNVDVLVIKSSRKKNCIELSCKNSLELKWNVNKIYIGNLKSSSRPIAFRPIAQNKNK